MFRAGSSCFYSCFALAGAVPLVYGDTRMSGNATTYAWAEAADEDLTCAEAAALLGIPSARHEPEPRGRRAGQLGCKRLRGCEADAHAVAELRHRHDLDVEPVARRPARRGAGRLERDLPRMHGDRHVPRRRREREHLAAAL